MFTFDKSNFRQFAISALGAVAMSAACVVGAVGPAKAATASPIAQIAAR